MRIHRACTFFRTPITTTLSTREDDDILGRLLRVPGGFVCGKKLPTLIRSSMVGILYLCCGQQRMSILYVFIRWRSKALKTSSDQQLQGDDLPGIFDLAFAGRAAFNALASETSRWNYDVMLPPRCHYSLRIESNAITMYLL